MFGNKELLKAIAMFLLIRKRLGSNILKDYSVNKLVNLLGTHARTHDKEAHACVSPVWSCHDSGKDPHVAFCCFKARKAQC